MQKAYKLLALQEGISNKQAKELIDAGVVSIANNKLSLARAEVKDDTVFKVFYPLKPRKIFEDDKIIAVNKPAFIISESLEKMFGAKLLNRLDKETSGVVLLYKDEEFQKIAIEEFRKNRVEKVYYAAVKGIVAEEFEVDLPITTIKTKTGAFSKIDLLRGKNAKSIITPFLISGKRSLVEVSIETGRTHQIRCHLANAKFPIIGDEKYGKNTSKRMYLHSYKIKLLDYEFKAPLDKSFEFLGFEIPKELRGWF